MAHQHKLDQRVKTKTRIESGAKLLESLNFRFIEDYFEELINKVHGGNDGSIDGKIKSLMQQTYELISGMNSTRDEKANQSIIDFFVYHCDQLQRPEH